MLLSMYAFQVPCQVKLAVISLRVFQYHRFFFSHDNNMVSPLGGGWSYEISEVIFKSYTA